MPDLHRVDSNLIVVLDAILSEKNLTRAGELIGMTQPAVSGALARLRQQYDDPLLVRTGRSYELTPKAEALLPVVEEAMAEIARTLEVLPTFDPETSTRTFLVSASDYVLSVMTAPLLELLGQQAPGTGVSFEALPTEQIVSPNDLLRRDVFVTGTGRGVPGKRQSLFSDRFVCIADARNPRLREGALSLADLAELRHVMSNFGELALTHVDDMLSSAGIAPKVGVSVQGFLPVPFMVSGTAMIGHVPERLALLHRESLGLTIAETPLNASTLIEAAHWHPSKNDDPAIEWLVGVLRKAAELIEFGDDAE
ncbi:DNA-binding transcriptional LysR family regulator [Homoserinimonas aerilata]|uniref:DNA-binding transcriptional LysR family regulator n=1 Tax=Homoserinimonas aerilata TaxID=1162970 RepID=A0A542YJZ0_9MICO|nr:LysR family transcriptional regulator [Homoserinimonas aerilata]TQL48417.1 DNA-binding transcriptional LysR family regulator [Homoserinimonas aerilata]